MESRATESRWNIPDDIKWTTDYETCSVREGISVWRRDDYIHSVYSTQTFPNNLVPNVTFWSQTCVKGHILPYNLFWLENTVTEFPVLVGSWNELDIKSDTLTIVLHLLLAPVGTVLKSTEHEVNRRQSQINEASPPTVIWKSRRTNSKTQSRGEVQTVKLLSFRMISDRIFDRTLLTS